MSQNETQVPLRDSPQRWWLMASLVSGMFFCYAQRSALGIAAPFMMRELGLKPGVMGILLSAFSWSYSVMQVPAGWLVDRLGVRRLYSFGFALWSIATALTGFMRGMIQLIITRIVIGLGQAIAFPASARAVANWFQDRERGLVSASYLTGLRLGQASINAIGAYFIVHYGLKTFFGMVGLLPMLWILPWSSLLKKWEQRTTDGQNAVSERPAAGGLSFLGSLALFRERSVIGIFLGFFAYDYVWYVYVYWFPSYLDIERKFTPAEVGVYSSFPFVIMSVVILLSGIASDALIRAGFAEVKVRRALIVAGLAIACLIVPAGFVSDRIVAVWLMTLSMCGLGIATPNTWALTQAVCAKEIVGTASGIQNLGGNLGGILAPAVTGYIAQSFHSFVPAFELSGLILIFGIASYSLLIKSGSQSTLSVVGG